MRQSGAPAVFFLVGCAMTSEDVVVLLGLLRQLLTVGLVVALGVWVGVGVAVFRLVVLGKNQRHLL